MIIFNSKNTFIVATLCAVFLLALCVRCSKNDTPAQSGPVIFTLIVPASFNTSTSDDWIFATTLEGKPLDAQRYEGGQTVTLRSSESLTNNQFNIHFFDNVQVLLPVHQIVSVSTYTGISAGTSWTLSNGSSFPLSDVTGNATLSITNYSNPTYSFETDPNIMFSTINGPMGGTYSENSSLLTVNLELNNTLPTNVFVTALRNNVPVYLQLGPLSNGASASADFTSDFNPMESTITVNNLGDYYNFDTYTSGFYPGDDTKSYGYYNSRYFGLGPATLAYADGFETYKTKIQIDDQSNKRSRIYFKLGTKASSLTLPDVTLSVSDSSIMHPQFSFSNTFHSAYMSWAKKATIGGMGYVFLWGMNTSEVPFIIQNIPDQIRAAYPFMTLDSFHYNGCTAMQYLDGFSYESLINSISDPNHFGEASKEYILSTFRR